MSSSVRKSEEIIWRRQQQMNNGEGNFPMLSRHDGEPQMQTTKGKPYFYITLAKESPQRIYEESDASTYDIDFHCMETDICRDSSDTDSSFTTDGIATMEVLEYEVRSASSSEDLYSNNSSSGSDDGLFLAAVATGAIYETSTSYSSAFADTEESDSDNSYDPELSAADYWVCVKCKNKQNNPMFRYCEKCYQIRKNHFPPRPRQWKSRSKKGHKTSPCSRRTRSRERNTPNKCRNGSVDSDVDVDVINRLGNFDGISSKKQVKSKFHNCSRKYNNNNSKSQLNSAVETSSEEEDNWSDSYTKNLNIPKKKSNSSFGMKGEKLSTKPSSSQNINLGANISNRLDYNVNRKRRLSFDDNRTIRSAKVSKTENIDFGATPDSDSETDTTSYINIQLQKDSGISSAPPSSQEVHSSCQSDEHQNIEKADDDHDNSDDTVCEELDEKDIQELEELNQSNNEPNMSKLHRHVSDISSLQSTNSDKSEKGSLVKSVSANIEQAHNVLSHEEKSKNGTDFEMCTVCFSEPKNGVLVHSKSAHLYSCYKCAVKIWNKNKRCPICNCTVKNIIKLFVY